MTHLEPCGYAPVPFSLSLWMYTTRKTKFCLCVYDFDVKFYSKNDADHLIEALQKGYPVKVDWRGENCCGFKLDWHYTKGYVDMSMSTCIPKCLQKLPPDYTRKRQKLPHAWTIPVYGQKR